MKVVVPVVGELKLTSFKMKVLFLLTVCLGVIFIAINVTVGSPPGSRSQGIVQAQSQEINVVDEQDVADLKTLRLVQVLFRHGDRTPIDHYAKDPYDTRTYWKEGYGKLTERGKLMQYKLGQYIRHRYNGFISPEYTADEIYVQSSDYDRTIMSAMANLAGMWPATLQENPELPQGARQQFVPVHVIAESLDNKIGYSKPCPKYDKKFAEVISSPSEKEFNAQHENLYKELSEYTGQNITSYFNVSDLYDILFVQKSHNFTLPTWTKNYYPDKMLPLAEHWIKVFGSNKEMRVLRASPLLTEFVRNMKRITANPTEEEKQLLEKLFHIPYVKFYMYSGHDSTLSAILDGLGLFDGKLPSYASSLYLELHQNEIDKEYFVKIFYRRGIEKPAVELELKNCKSQPCHISFFMEMLNGYILDEKQWEIQCHL